MGLVRQEFSGGSYEEHVNAAIVCIEGIARYLWALSAVCASLERVHGDDSVGKFASDIGRSARSVRELAQTYRVWSEPERIGERSPVLSFRHHTIAGRSRDPVRALRFAEDHELSTRQLDAFVSHEAEVAAEGGEAVAVLESRVSEASDAHEYGHWDRCPACEGLGRIWKED